MTSSNLLSCYFITLPWRHNDHNGVSNHQPHGCLLNRLFRRRSKKTSKLRVTGLCVGNSPDRWIPRTKGQLRGKYFHLMTSSWLMTCFLHLFQIYTKLTTQPTFTTQIKLIIPTTEPCYTIGLHNSAEGSRIAGYWSLLRYTTRVMFIADWKAVFATSSLGWRHVSVMAS